jgi:hypothetical protein
MLANRLATAALLAFLASSLVPLSSPHAAPQIGNTVLTITPVQRRTIIVGTNCNFGTGQAQPGHEGGCEEGDGSYYKSGDLYFLSMKNTENLKNQKTVLLSITLTKDGAMNFVPIMGEIPPLNPDFSPPLPPGQSAVTKPIAEAWLPDQGLLQFEWTIFPQPSSEYDFLFFNVKKNGAVTRFNVNWIQKISMASHCPEPATWMSLTLGVGLVGQSLRRRRTRTARQSLAAPA